MSAVTSLKKELSDILAKGNTDHFAGHGHTAAVNEKHVSDDAIRDAYHELLIQLKNDNMGFLYTRWESRWKEETTWPASHQHPAWDEDTQNTHDKLDQMKGLHWGLMDDLARRVSVMAQVGDAVRQYCDAIMNELDNVWRGEAADAAKKKFEDLKAAAGDYQSRNEQLAKLIWGIRKTTKEMIDSQNGSNYGPPHDIVKLTKIEPITTFLAHYSPGLDADGDPTFLPDPDNGFDHSYHATEQCERSDWSTMMDQIKGRSRVDLLKVDAKAFASDSDTTTSLSADDGSGNDVDSSETDQRGYLWTRRMYVWDEFCGCYNAVMDTLVTGIGGTYDGLRNTLQHATSQLDDPKHYDPFSKILIPGAGKAPNDPTKHPSPNGNPLGDMNKQMQQQQKSAEATQAAAQKQAEQQSKSMQEQMQKQQEAAQKQSEAAQKRAAQQAGAMGNFKSQAMSPGTTSAGAYKPPKQPKLQDLKQPDMKQPDLKQPDMKEPDFKSGADKLGDFKQPDMKSEKFDPGNFKTPDFKDPSFGGTSASGFSGGHTPDFSSHSAGLGSLASGLGKDSSGTSPSSATGMISGGLGSGLGAGSSSTAGLGKGKSGGLNAGDGGAVGGVGQDGGGAPTTAAAAGAQNGAAGAKPGASGGGMMGGMGGAGKGQGGEEKEHKRKFKYTASPDELFGSDEKSVPPVIGEQVPQPTSKRKPR